MVVTRNWKGWGKEVKKKLNKAALKHKKELVLVFYSTVLTVG
jgi:hypothetical protein